MLEKIEELQTLARTLNFSAAAAELHISQPSLTRHIASLEKELGLTIFNRTPMTLTPEGQYYVAATAKLLEDYEHIVQECHRIAQFDRESLSINMAIASHTIWSTWIYEAITRLEEILPGTPTPHLCQSKNVTIEASVLTGLADVGVIFRSMPIVPDGFALRKIGELPLAVYFTPDSDLAASSHASFSDLQEKYLVCPSNPQLKCLFDAAIDVFRANGVEPKYRVREFDDYDRIAYLLRSDEIVFGYTIEAFTPGLQSCPMVDQHVTHPVYLLYRTVNAKSATLPFVDLCEQIAAREQERWH